MSDIVNRALTLAARAHEGQRRKVDDSPYITHPFAVALIVQKYGYEDSLVAAALLHDTLEDTSLTPAAIADACGAAVLAIVLGCTEVSGPWRSRKENMIERLHQAPIAIKVVAAADKLHNVGQLPPLGSVESSPAWRHFKRGAVDQAWYYRHVAAAISANVPEITAHPLLAALTDTVAHIFASLPP